MSKDDVRPGVIPPQTPAQKKACAAVELVMDKEGRTAIVLEETKTEVAFIPLAVEGLYMTYTSPSVFRQRFPLSHRDEKAPKSLRGTNVAAAARCYVTHATYCGADQPAVEALERLVPITKAEKEKIHMSKESKKTKEKPEAATKSAKPSKEGAAKGAKPVKAKGEGRMSVASSFRELIMKGNLTDDQIFAEVQKRHPEVKDDKRKYVAWYRNDLVKKGENPPAQKKAPKDKKAA